MNRRIFIQDFTRYTLLGGLLSSIGFLISERTIKTTDDCTASEVCKMCGKFNSCQKVTDLKANGHGKIS
ncbi:MAG: hypothetical protein PVH48_00970 [Cyclobacteriaceae bacterium]